MKIKKTYLRIAQDRPLRITTEIVPNKGKSFTVCGSMRCFLKHHTITRENVPEECLKGRKVVSTVQPGSAGGLEPTYPG